MPKNVLPYKDKKPRLGESVYIDPYARVLGDVEVGSYSVISFGAIVRGDDEKVTIGRRTVLLENVIVEAPEGRPVFIGDDVLISHGAIVHGAVVEKDVLIGIGAIVLDNSIVREGSIIGAGAVVTPNSKIPPRSLVVGVPARVVREVSYDEIKYMKGELDRVLLKAREYSKVLFDDG